MVSLVILRIFAVGAALVAHPADAAEDPVKTIAALEERWTAATVAKDAALLKAIIAPDWHGQNGEKLRVERDEAIAQILSPDLVITASHNHDVLVRVFGTLAVVQGANDETSSYKGKPISGTYSWTDVFENRDGNWVAVASQGTKLEKP